MNVKRIVVLSRDKRRKRDVVRRLVRSAEGCHRCEVIRKTAKLFEFGFYRNFQFEWDGKLYCSKPCHDRGVLFPELGNGGRTKSSDVRSAPAARQAARRDGR